jgi:hydrogenase maturation protease
MHQLFNALPETSHRTILGYHASEFVMTSNQANDSTVSASRRREAGHAIVIVGMGSSHGDDQLGWMVACALDDSKSGCYEVHQASSPIEILNWIDDARQLHIVDACVTGAVPGTLHRIEWPTQEAIDCQWSGTHDMHLVAALKLADQLGQLPMNVTLWGIEGVAFGPATSPTKGSDAWVRHAVRKIAQAIKDSLQAELDNAMRRPELLREAERHGGSNHA